MDLTTLPHGSTKVEGEGRGTSPLFPPQRQQLLEESLKASVTSCTYVCVHTHTYIHTPHHHVTLGSLC